MRWRRDKVVSTTQRGQESLLILVALPLKTACHEFSTFRLPGPLDFLFLLKMEESREGFLLPQSLLIENREI